jgi:hypothetical protein
MALNTAKDFLLKKRGVVLKHLNEAEYGMMKASLKMVEQQDPDWFVRHVEIRGSRRVGDEHFY